MRKNAKTSHWGTPDSIPSWNMLSMLIFSKEFGKLQVGWSKDPGPSLARMFLAFFVCHPEHGCIVIQD